MLIRRINLPLAALSVALVPLTPAVNGFDQPHAPHTRANSPRVGTTANRSQSPHWARLRLIAAPSTPLAGQRVQLRVERGPTDGTDYRWDLTGRGGYTLDTGSTPSASIKLLTPGLHRFAVRVTRANALRVTSLSLNVRPRRTKGFEVADDGRPVRLHHQRPRAFRAVLSANIVHPTGDPPVSIADFQFTPATTTLQVGQTITWTNHGPSAHTATAQDGSFDSGTLQSGQSASHTFSHAGTFAYFCRIHPFMHGTVVVLGGAGSATPSPGSGNSGGGSHATSAPASGSVGSTGSSSSLPLTGLDLIAVVGTGLLLSAAGTTLRVTLCR